MTEDEKFDRMADGCGQGCFEVFVLFALGMILFLGVCALCKTNPFAG